MSKYETENIYIDGDENRPRALVMLGIIILIVLILVLVISCGMKGKSTNNYLSKLNISNGELSPKFDKNVTTYTVIPKSDKLVVYCTAESLKATAKGCNKAINLSKDGTTHKVVVTAENNTTKTYVLNFNKTGSKTEDKDTKDETEVKETSEIATNETLQKVVITSDIESGKKTNKKVLLTASVTPSNTKFDYIWYKDGIEIKNSNSNKYEASTSGIYYVRVTDGTVVKESNIYRVNISGSTNATTVSTNKTTKSNTTKQTTLKINSVTGNATSWVKSVTLKVNAEGAKYYSFDGGKNYQTSNTKTFTKNGTYTIVVKSSTGKTVSKQIVINKIDNTDVKVTISASNNTGKSVMLTANVSSNTSTNGFKYEWYVNNKIIVGANKSTFKATMDGTYKIKVTTETGKSVYSNEYKFDKVKVTCPTLSATTESGKNAEPYKWYNEYIYIKIEPSKETVSYDVHMNEDGHYDVLNKYFKYFNTYNGNVKVRIVNGGIRVLKIVVKDSVGNTNICYSHAYYLR